MSDVHPLLKVHDFSMGFQRLGCIVMAVHHIHFEIYPGQTLCLVGESGCGKSVTALSILRLLGSSYGNIESGSMMFDGQDLLKKNERDMQHIRGNRISMIFQEPMTSLNPVFTVGHQIAEVFRTHQKISKAEAKVKAQGMLDLVKIPAAHTRYHAYPHELSGGMRQRIMIAMALACRPALLIADEPTTALDVTIQAQILDLIKELQMELNMAVLLITHDLGVVAEVCDKVAIMYAGHIVEQASIEDIFKAPFHPYTKGLLAAIPRLGQGHKKALQPIPGMVPTLGALPKGCAFHPRCAQAMDKCAVEDPPWRKLSEAQLSEAHGVCCWLHGLPS